MIAVEWNVGNHWDSQFVFREGISSCCEKESTSIKLMIAQCRIQRRSPSMFANIKHGIGTSFEQGTDLGAIPHLAESDDALKLRECVMRDNSLHC
jgi:hypothetical protein